MAHPRPQLEGVEEPPRFSIEHYDDAVFALRSPDFIPLHPKSGRRGAYQSMFSRGTVVDIDGDVHAERRRLLAPLMRKANLLDLEVSAVVPRVQAAIDEAVAAGGPTDLLPINRRLMLGLMSRVTGIPAISDPANADEFEKAFADLEQGVRIRYAKEPEDFYDRALDARAVIFDKYVRGAFADRQRQMDESGQPDPGNDLIGIMLTHRPHYENFDDEAMYREVTVFITAALGSTSNAILHTLSDLIKWVDADPQERRHLVLDPAFLNRAFRESQRLHQANPIWRTNTAAVTLPSGAELAANTVVDIRRPLANTELAARGHSDAAPDAFDPAREIPGGEPDYGLAFGTGSHMCLGRQLLLADGPHGTYTGGERMGLATATLIGYFHAGIKLVDGDPPEIVAGVDRQTIRRFPVEFDKSRLPAHA